jgi:hypothetical protein
MKKLIILSILFISALVYPINKNWYLSTTSSGTGNADSWANKKYWRTFNQSLVMPGDTVFLDGGQDSLIYIHPGDAVIATFIWNRSGVSNKKIIITRGKESGHNGVPIIRGTNTIDKYAFFIDANYLELSYLHVDGVKSGNGVSYKGAIQLVTTDHIDIFHNTIKCPSSFGISGTASNIRIMYNTITTNGVVSDDGGNDLIDIQGSNIGNSTEGNAEVAYNYLLMQNMYTGTNNHRDVIGFGYWQLAGGTTKIHHNFIASITPGKTYSTQIMYNSVFGGKWEIYNNIFVQHTGIGGNNSQIFVMNGNKQYTTSTEPAVVKAYNNTIYAENGNLGFGDLDTLIFKNNLVMSRTGQGRLVFDLGKKNIQETCYFDFANNRYFFPLDTINVCYDVPARANIGWSRWRSIVGDTNSVFAPYSLVDSSGSTNPLHYALKPGSVGIDSGIPISLFNDDYEGKQRPLGAAWDIGAFEYDSENNGGDINPPGLIGAMLTSPTTLELSFTEPIERNSAINKMNYIINNGVFVNSASVSADYKNVTLITSSHSSGTFFVTANVRDQAGNLISTNQKTSHYISDFTPPNLLSAVLLDSLNLELIFSEALDSVSACSIGNYSINSGINIVNAVLYSGLTKIKLTTSIHTLGQNYTVSVQNVKDLRNNVISSTENSKQYFYQADVDAPELNQLSLSNSKSVTVVFSEYLDPAAATNKNNYNISNNITINSVQLLPDSSSVLLKTSAHQRDIDYTLTILHVTDRSGNHITPCPKTISYKLPKKGNGLIIQYPIQQASSGTWIQNYLPEKTIDGFSMNHPESRWLSSVPMPDTLNLNLGSSLPIDSMRISFFGWESGTKYKYSIYSSIDSIFWIANIENIWSENIEWNEVEFQSTPAQFIRIVLIEGNITPFGSIWEIELFGSSVLSDINLETNTAKDFVLSQNYPNPFNPSTIISVNLPKETYFRLAVYNILGELIDELANGEYTAGLYNFNFESRNLSSGIYIYRIESNEFIETKKMMLVR